MQSSMKNGLSYKDVVTAGSVLAAAVTSASDDAPKRVLDKMDAARAIDSTIAWTKPSEMAEQTRTRKKAEKAERKEKKKQMQEAAEEEEAQLRKLARKQAKRERRLEEKAKIKTEMVQGAGHPTIEREAKRACRVERDTSENRASLQLQAEMEAAADPALEQSASGGDTHEGSLVSVAPAMQSREGSPVHLDMADFDSEVEAEEAARRNEEYNGGGNQGGSGGEQSVVKQEALVSAGNSMSNGTSLSPVASGERTHEDAAHDLLDLMFAGGGIGGGGNVGGGDGGGGGGDGGGAHDELNVGDGMPTLDEYPPGDEMEHEDALEVDGDFGGGGHGAAAAGHPLQQLPIVRPFGVASEAEARAAQERADPGLLVEAQEQAAAEVLLERQAAAQQQVFEEERLARRAQVAAQVAAAQAAAAQEAAAQAAHGDAGEEPLVIVAHGTRVWTEKQRLALALFGEGRSLALLGFAGTGKTVRGSSLEP